MKEAMGHGGIQQRRDHASVDDPLIALQKKVRLQSGADIPIRVGPEGNLQRPGVALTAQETAAMVVLGTDAQMIDGHRCPPSPALRR
jgi:hypothetical protein